MKQSLLGFIIITAALQVLLIAVLGCKVWTLYPSNHIAYDIRWGLLLSGLNIAAVCVGLRWLSKTNWILHTAGIISLVSGATILLLDCFNVLVAYEVWLKRGMPGVGT